jgi:AcrR family transcriptional regulator
MTEAVAAPVRRRSKNRKAEIALAAAELFAVHGYAAVSVDDIGARVGITGPALYRHYPGKQAVVTDILDTTMAALVDAATPDPGTEPDLRTIIGRTVSMAMASPAAFTVWLHDARHHDPETMAAFRRQRRRAGRFWHQAELAVAPGLADAELRVREEAVVAVINALSRRPGAVTRSRVEALVLELAMAVVRDATPPPEPRRPGPAAAARHGAQRPWTSAPSRRDTILGVAVPMFRRRGFAGVSMDEIGEAAGITGPSVYRYYDSKAAILVDAFDRTDSRVALAVEQSLAESTSAEHALELLVGAYAQIALDSADLVVVTTRETQALPPEERARQARRGRANADHWVAVVASLHADLPDAEVRLVVRAMFGLTNHLVQLPDPPSAEVISALAMAVARCKADR